MKHWRVQLTSDGETLAEVNVRRGVFQGDNLSPILFVIALIPLSIILNKSKEGYLLGAQRGKLNHPIFMDDLQLYAKDIRQLE